MAGLEEILPEWFEFLSQVKNQQSILHDESLTKIEELQSQIESLKNNQNSVKQILTQKELALSKSEDNLKQLTDEKNKLLVEIQSLEARKNNLIQKTSKPNVKDQQLLEKGRKKLSLFKSLTRIKWDYADKENIKGYVSNNMEYICAFSFKKEHNQENITNLLWKEIEKSCSSHDKDKECNKENKNVNK